MELEIIEINLFCVIYMYLIWDGKKKLSGIYEFFLKV